MRTPDGHPDAGAAIGADGAHPIEGYASRVVRSAVGVFVGVPLPSPPPGASWKPRFGVCESAPRDFRARLLLAPSRGMSACPDSKNQEAVLGRKVNRKQASRPPGPTRLNPRGLEDAGGLGMPTQEPPAARAKDRQIPCRLNLPELVGCAMAEAAVGPLDVLIPAPGLDLPAGVGQVVKAVRVGGFVAQAPVEALVVAVLHRAVKLNVN